MSWRLRQLLTELYDCGCLDMDQILRHLFVSMYIVVLSDQTVKSWPGNEWSVMAPSCARSCDCTFVATVRKALWCSTTLGGVWPPHMISGGILALRPLRRDASWAPLVKFEEALKKSNNRPGLQGFQACNQSLLPYTARPASHNRPKRNCAVHTCASLAKRMVS